MGKYKIMRCLNSCGTTNAKKHSKPLGYEPTLELDSILPKACGIIILYFLKSRKRNNQVKTINKLIKIRVGNA